MPWVKFQRPKIRTILLRILQFVFGAIAFVLFRWTPATGRGLAIFGVLAVVMVALAIMIAPKHEGYWPDPPENRK
jgi:hypothetical protein